MLHYLGENDREETKGIDRFHKQRNGCIPGFGGKNLPVRGRYANVFPCHEPVNPQYKDLNERQKTFASWPKRDILSPNELAAAGLFYLGDRDRCKCYYCNGGLQHWEHGDDPMVEHAKYFPQCEYVLQHKGPDFVSELNSRHPHLVRPGVANANTHVDHSPVSFEQQTQNSAGLQQSALEPIEPLEPIPPQSSPKPSSTSRENTELIEAAIQFGFSENAIKMLMEEKFQKEGTFYAGLSELICDLQKFEEKKNTPEAMTICQGHNHSHCQIEPQPLIKDGFWPKRTGTGSHSVFPTQLSAVVADGPRRLEADSALRSQLQTAMGESLCIVCHSRDRSCAFMACGHLCCCFECGQQMEHCPICNSKIIQAIRIYKV